VDFEAMGTALPETPLLPGDPAELYAGLRGAWERFIADGRLDRGYGVRRDILESWRQCLQAHLDPHTRRAPRGLEAEEIAELLQHDDFAIAGRQVLGDFAHVVEASGHVIVLADAGGRIFLEIGNPKTMLGLEEVNLSPGGLWCERAVGPNGIGTSLLRARACFVFGPEHFCEGWHPWVCYGTPVKDPVSGRTLGAVDISGPALRLDRSAFNFTLSLARSIERALGNVALEKRHALLEEFLGATRRWPGEGIVAVDEAGRIVHISTEAAQLIGEDHGPQTGEWINRPIEALLGTLGVKADVAAMRHEPAEWQGEGMLLHYWPLVARERMLGALLVMRATDSRPQAGPRSDLQTPAREPTRLARFDDVLGTSAAIRETVRAAQTAARGERTVLLTGETGTGKELFAQAIHTASARANGPFVAVNCAALPSELVESELFGYAPGAFTGARREGGRGKFEQAQRGTIFLDEIALMPFALQAKLLRVVETRTLTKLGGGLPLPLDVRIIAASNEDLRALAAQGKFRLDLYYRLDVMQVRCPPLRERAEDVMLLAKAFLARECGSSGRAALTLSSEVEAALRACQWPGNVRELQNLCARWAEMCTGTLVRLDDLPAEMRGARPSGAEAGHRTSDEHSVDERALDEHSLRAMEDRIIVAALQECGNNISAAARRLGVSRTTLYQKLRRIGRS
jgi:transcriptional regulator of acetoin/glycerol metabolism